jgi:hypothetical protein
MITITRITKLLSVLEDGRLAPLGPALTVRLSKWRRTGRHRIDTTTVAIWIFLAAGRPSLESNILLSIYAAGAAVPDGRPVQPGAD